MAEVTLKAIRRDDTGKGSARRARAAGRVPAIVYGLGMDPVAIEVDRREFVTALHTDAGMNVLLNIEVDGRSTTALTRELQQDPVRGTLLHADFVKIDLKQEVEVEVPVHLVGESPGAKEGGVLEHPLFTIHVRCLPTNVPESIDADISGLEIGDALRVSELAAGVDFQILNDPDTVVASVAAPITEEQLEAMVAEAGVGEAEEVEAEAAEVPEGEAAPAEGEAAPAEAGEAPAEEADQS
jgi:large subunit ribosomal protein L25